MARARRYRFRTAVLAGPWRPSRREALDDAVQAGQATREGAPAGELLWLVPGEVEEDRA